MATSKVSTSSKRKSGGVELEGNMWNECCTKDLDTNPWIAPVEYFKHTPFATKWHKIAKPGLFLEMPNPYTETMVDGDVSKLKWWFAEVVRFAGYRALVRFVKMDGDQGTTKYTWLPFFSDIPHQIGYCAKNGIELVPVQAELPQLDKKILKEKQASLKGKETLAPNHYQIVCLELQKKAQPFVNGMFVEALNIEDCSQYRLAEVVRMVGDRVKVKYCSRSDPGFWFSQRGNSIHKLGWCRTIGVSVEELEAWKLPRRDSIDTDRSLISHYNLPKTPKNIQLKQFMAFELRHPVLPHKIVAGYVAKVLEHGFFFAGTDWTRADELVEIILHVTSDYILPVNFCRDHGIPMAPPQDVVDPDKFDWEIYLITNPYVRSALELSAVRRPPNPFRKGNKLEAIDVVKASSIRPATVTAVAGHLLKIHFDGKDDKDRSYQWVSCASSSIYPVGYAEMVQHKTKGQPEMIVSSTEEKLENASLEK